MGFTPRWSAASVAIGAALTAEDPTAYERRALTELRLKCAERLPTGTLPQVRSWLFADPLQSLLARPLRHGKRIWGRVRGQSAG
jgi:hypothetical protein